MFTGPTLAASATVRPTITSTVATFKVPADSASTWTLRLWSHGTLEGSNTGTEGSLIVDVPHTVDCAFQADVTVTAPGGRPYFYSGTRVTMAKCGLIQTIAGHIYLCSSAGSPTSTEVSGGTLSATGPQTVPVQANPLPPTEVPGGGYAMTAGAPAGYLLIVCGGSAAVGSGGQTATEPVTVPSGGAGVGLFYVSTAPIGPGTAPAQSHPTAVVSTGPTPPTAHAPVAVAAGHSSPVRAVITASPRLAFTGMNIGPLVLLGLILLGLGALLIACAEPRRSRQPAPLVVVPQTPLDRGPAS